MEEYIENAYGKMYLSEERAKEFAEIVIKHIHSLFLDLKEHKIVPSHLSLEKTIIRELDDYNAIQAERLKEYQEKEKQNYQQDV